MNDGVGARQKTQVATTAELAAAREARRMSQLDISQRIKLQVRQVNALEEGQWDALPGKSFVRGALRSYGKLLDVDVAPLLESIGGFAEPAQVQGMQPLDTPLTRSSSGMGFNGGGRGSPILWVIAGLIGVVALVLYFGSDQDNGSRIRSWLPSSQTPADSTTEPAPPAAPAEGAPSPAGGGTSSTMPVSPGGTAPEPVASRSVGDAAGVPARATVGSGAESGATMAQQPAQQPAWVALQDLPQVSAQPKAPSASAASPAPASTDSSTPAGLAAAASPGAAGSASFGGRGADAVMPAVASSGSAGGAAAAHAAAEQPPTPIAMASVSSTDSTGSSADGKGGAVSPEPGAAVGLVRIKAQEDSWIEVRQADGVSLHNGLVKGGASIELKGTPPYRLVLGNASHVELSYDGKVQDLKAHTRANNIARLQLR